MDAAAAISRSARALADAPVRSESHKAGRDGTHHIERVAEVVEAKLPREKRPACDLQQVSSAGGDERILNIVRCGGDRNAGSQEVLYPRQSTRR